MNMMETVVHGKEDLLKNLPDVDATAILKAGIALGGLTEFTINGIPHIAVPDGVDIENLEKTLPNPVRVRSEFAFEEPDSFCAYVGEFKAANTRLYGSPDAFSMMAILDDNAPDMPHWREHKAGLSLKKSPEWNEWMAACGKGLSQRDLADFLDAHIEQIAEPDASDLLSDIRTIHISTNTRVESVQHEGGDIAFSYATETAAGTKTERGKIPSKLILLIAPFRSWKPVQMTVMLTYTHTREKELLFVMRPHQADALQQMVFNDVRNHVQEKLGLPVLV